MPDQNNLIGLITSPNPTPRTLMILDVARLCFRYNKNVRDRDVEYIVTVLYRWGYITEQDGVTLERKSYGKVILDVTRTHELIRVGWLSERS